MTRRAPQRGERGSVMIVVITMITALMLGAGVALYLQIADTRGAGLIRTSRASLYCAEAGLAASRPVIGANYTLWPDMLDTDDTNDPIWYPMTGDIDGDGVDDYEVEIVDNDDEFLPDTLDPNTDNDLKIFVVSRCTKYPDTPREVLELVIYSGGGSVYRNQSGQGSGNTGNAN
jgi:hypothetical protein